MSCKEHRQRAVAIIVIITIVFDAFKQMAVDRPLQMRVQIRFRFLQWLGRYHLILEFLKFNGDNDLVFR